MPKPLTDPVVKNLRPSIGQIGWKEIADSGCRGLALRLSPEGERVWAIRTNVGGKRQRHTLGSYPSVGIGEARRRAKEYQSAAREGQRPGEVDAQIKALKMTVTTAHGDYVTAMGGALRQHTVNMKKAMFKQHVAPQIGDRLVGSIRAGDISEVVASVVEKGFRVQATRVFSELMALLKWCEEMRYISGVPTKRRKSLRTIGAAKETPRRRTLIDSEIKELWDLVGGMGPLTRDFVRLLLLTGQRSVEVRCMVWEELNLADALWVIPAGRYKTGITHAVPLPPAALAIIKARWSIGASGPVLAGRKKGQPFNGAAGAMTRIREKIEGKGDFTFHDIRRTLRTGLSRLGVDEKTAELVIGHLPEGISAVYDVYDRLAERKAALESWQQFVLSVVSGADNVVPIHGNSSGG